MDQGKWRPSGHRLPALAVLGTLIGCSLTLAQDNTRPPDPSVATANPYQGWCTLDAAPEVSADGIVRLALVVGVGTFENTNITPLLAPAEDAAAVADLITAPAGYRFPKQNVCVLTDQQGTRSAFTTYFRRALSERTRTSAEKHRVQVLVYFSGHGSYATDNSKDEPDGRDELLVLHDSWAKGVSPLRDDELNRMIASLYPLTQDIVVILDSCHSGSATKGTDDDIEKMTPPLAGPVSGDDTGPDLDTLQGITRLSASRDGTSALAPRGGGKSFFTAALQNALAPVGAQPLSWEQVARRMRVEISESTRGRQLPVFQGDLTKLVFSAKDRARPYGWVIDSVAGGQLKLRGVPLPGWGDGAELRIYDGNVDRNEVSNPQAAKASALIVDFHSISADAELTGDPRAEIRPGDIAVLSIASASARRLAVRLSSTGRTALPPAVVASITTLMKAREDVRDLMSLSMDRGAFTVESDGPRYFAIRGPEGVIRASKLPLSVEGVLSRLLNFARQQVILSIEGEPGAGMRNNETLRVRLAGLPPAAGSSCPQRNRAVQQWVEQCPNEEQALPVCSHWRLEVANAGRIALRVGGVALLNDGKTIALPSDSENLVLPPDGKFYPLDRGGIQSAPPLNVPEYVVVFGTDQSLDIDWALLNDPTTEKKGAAHPLARTLRGLMVGVKGGDYVAQVDTAPWTTTKVPLRVVVNPQFEIRDVAARSCKTIEDKEYTVAAFDIDPYLPGENNALRKVLLTGYDLAGRAPKAGGTDGIPYSQHYWDKGSGKALPGDDKLNLGEGIDCARAIWFAFTRNDLPYTSRRWHTGYLATAEMFDAELGSCSDKTPKRTLMHENFESCMGDDLQTGDVLVYQGKHPDSGKCVGHTVMVVDPDRFVGWGSHGWDGSKDDEGKRLNDTGVEYQEILQGGWAKWDRKQFRLKACWRHREFIKKEQTTAAARNGAPR